MSGRGGRGARGRSRGRAAPVSSAAQHHPSQPQESQERHQDGRGRAPSRPGAGARGGRGGPHGGAGDHGGASSLASSMSSMKMADSQLEPNEYSGTSGRPLQVSVTPVIDNSKAISRILCNHPGLPDPPALRLCSGGSLFLRTRLPNQETELVHKSDRGSEQVFTFKLSLTGEVKQGTDVHEHVMNLLLKRAMRFLDLVQTRRNYFDPGNKVVIDGHDLEVWPGYVTAIANYHGGLFLNLDLIHKLMRTTTAYDELMRIHNESRGRPDPRTLESAVVGQTVMTSYNNKTYKVIGVDLSKTPASTFKKRDRDISFAQYMLEQYDLKVQDMNQPLLDAELPPTKEERMRAKAEGKPLICRTALLIPAFCVLTGVTDRQKGDFGLMREVAKVTSVAPHIRLDQYAKYFTRLNQKDPIRELFDGWDFTLDPQPVAVCARKLPNPQMRMFGRDRHQAPFQADERKADWRNELQRHRLYRTAQLNNWLMLYPDRAQQQAHQLLQAMGNAMYDMGFEMTQPKHCLVQNSARGYTEAIKREVQGNKELEFVVFIMMGPGNIYDAVKQLLFLQLGIGSQGVLLKTLSKPKMFKSVAVNIGMQINCKLGGALWGVDIPMGGLMTIGVDVYHDTVNKKMSVGAFVASLKNCQTAFYSKAIMHAQSQELFTGLGQHIRSALMLFDRANGQPPKFIIMYRDGVGDGQLSAVKDSEVKQLKQGIALFEREREARTSERLEPIKFIMLIVKKRISTRFFEVGRGGACNPTPGTILDSVVTQPGWYEFFIVPQSVNQGSATPTNFHVIEGERVLKPDHLQQLTYRLCFMYYNWPGTVRVPAPCQYAHKLALIIGENVHSDQLDAKLLDKLFYL